MADYFEQIQYKLLFLVDSLSLLLLLLLLLPLPPSDTLLATLAIDMADSDRFNAGSSFSRFGFTFRIRGTSTSTPSLIPTNPTRP